MNKRLLIKKYTNRRLYDTEASTYITLDQLAEKIKEGRQIEVIDAQTNSDVTIFILTQVIMEQAKHNNPLLPLPLLHLIIRYGDDTLQEFFSKYLEEIIQAYLSYKASADEKFREWLSMGKGISEMASKTMTSLAPFPSFSDISGDSEKKERTKNVE